LKLTTTFAHSGIFGYINYLVEKDRKYILNTLINGKFPFHCAPLELQKLFGAPELTGVL
jgi:hypothetical protein